MHAGHVCSREVEFDGEQEANDWDDELEDFTSEEVRASQSQRKPALPQP